MTEPQALDSIHLVGRDLGRNVADETTRNFVLVFEHLIQGPVVTRRPDLTAGRGIDQPSSDTHNSRRFSNGSLEHVAGPKVAGDRLGVYARAPGVETGLAGGHE